MREQVRDMIRQSQDSLRDEMRLSSENLRIEMAERLAEQQQEQNGADDGEQILIDRVQP